LDESIIPFCLEFFYCPYSRLRLPPDFINALLYGCVFEPRAVYSRKGKTPGEKRLQLDCTIYINPGVNSPVEQDIIDRILKPFINMANKGIEARIIFDGQTFEIRQHPTQHGNSLIFKAENFYP
jgi:hypothetical protein